MVHFGPANQSDTVAGVSCQSIKCNRCRILNKVANTIILH